MSEQSESTLSIVITLLMGATVLMIPFYGIIPLLIVLAAVIMGLKGGRGELRKPSWKGTKKRKGKRHVAGRSS